MEPRPPNRPPTAPPAVSQSDSQSRLDATAWEQILSARLERPVQVRFGRARTQPVQSVSRPEGVSVRLHEFFAQAPPEIADALAAWLRAGRRARNACRRLDAWIDERLAALPPPRPRAPQIEPAGRVHDLTGLAAPLWTAEFADDFFMRPQPHLTWGRRTRSRARRSLHLGSFTPDQDVVRVHSVLDHESVPAWFVTFLLFHEILHAAVDPRGHGPRFRKRERAYADYDRAVSWQRTHFGRLLRRARSL